MTEDQRRFVSRTRSDLEAGADVTIVAYGDSITAGFAVRRGFPSFWKEMLDEKYPEAGLEMINSGISGDTTLDGLSRLDWAALSYEPDLVTINFGINDCVLGLGLEEFEMNLVEMVRRIRALAASKELYVYNWSEYMPDSVLEDFTKETGIKVVMSTYDSNEALYAKIKMVDAKGYDLIVPSTDFVARMRKGDPADPLGPRWVEEVGRDLTALGEDALARVEEWM